MLSCFVQVIIIFFPLRLTGLIPVSFSGATGAEEEAGLAVLFGYDVFFGAVDVTGFFVAAGDDEVPGFFVADGFLVVAGVPVTNHDGSWYGVPVGSSVSSGSVGYFI